MRTYPVYLPQDSSPPSSQPQPPMAAASAADGQGGTNSKDDSRPSSPKLPDIHTMISSRPPGQPSTSSNVSQKQPADPKSSPSAEQTASTIQAILAATKKPPSPIVQTATWAPPPQSSQRDSGNANALPGPSSLAHRGSKRKYDTAEPEDAHNKIRRVVREHVTHDPTRIVPMTTVLCLHAAVAQKSYGSEKRFLCPPPVVHIEGPIWNMKAQQLAMAVVSEGGERSFEQRAPFDHNLTASFKFLHVTGTAKTKSFQLSLDISEPAATENNETTSGRVWASFDSAPVTIISKPSKKTAKTRNISSCILAGGPVSLFNRINSQTVRTKYMTVDRTQLCASNVSWSAFNVNVVSSQGPQPQPVTYGSEIVLTDTVSGTQTAPLIIRKVDKGRIVPDDGGPVSQMQKIALQRINPDGTRHYLSATGPAPGTPGVVVPTTPGLQNQAGTHPLIFQAPRIREDNKDGVRIITDEVDDYLCWTIVGISKFQYTFFDAFGQNNDIPELPITPFPTLFTAPAYRPSNNTLELTVANFFYEDPKTRLQTPLEVYVGGLGPLRHRLYQATPPGPLTNVSPFVQHVKEAENQNSVYPPNAQPPLPTRYMPPGPVHTIVIVDMPAIGDVIKALEEDATTPSGDDSPGRSRTSQNGESSSGSQIPKAADAQSIAGRSLPLLFIRSLDGVGYHSGRAVACENVFQSMDLAGMGGTNPTTGSIDTGWLAAAQAAATVEGGLHGWTLRVI
ncbi:Su(H) family protein [Abortiporus biennis]